MISIRGYRGHLVAASYLATELARTRPDAEGKGWHHLRQALTHLEKVGPATSARQMLELVIAPLVETLGFGVLHEVEPVGDVIAASMVRRLPVDLPQGLSERRVTVIVTP